MNFLPGGKLLPGDWVEEAKLLLFVKMEVTNRPPKKGKRLNEAKRKRPGEEKAHGGKKKKQLGGAVMVEINEDVELLDESIIFEGDDDNVQPPVVLMYNLVRGYVSAIHELWSHQTSQGIHQAPEPHRFAIKALETSLVRVEHMRQRKEYTDRVIGTMRDGYLQCQILGLTHQVWSLAFGEKAIEQSF